MSETAAETAPVADPLPYSNPEVAEFSETGTTAADTAPAPAETAHPAAEPAPAPTAAEQPAPETSPVADPSLHSAPEERHTPETVPTTTGTMPGTTETAPVADPIPYSAPVVASPTDKSLPATDRSSVEAETSLVATEPTEAPAQPKPIVAPLATAANAALSADDNEIQKIIGQMIILGFDGQEPDDDGPKDAMAQILSGKIGGVLFAKRNIESPAQLKTLTKAFRTVRAEPIPFLMVTHEGGTAKNLSANKGFSTFPSAAELGKSNDPLIAFSVYQNMADELSILGFNVNLGPVLDLASPESEAFRPGESGSYGASPKHVAAFANAFRMAHEDKGILTVAKHFPGLSKPNAVTPGSEDAEQSGPVDGNWDVSALEPYRELAAGDRLDIVMVGHFSNPAFSDEPSLPASFSAKAIQKLLREDIGFQGVVMSDDLEAPGLSERFPLKERVLRAINAGNDLLLIGSSAAPDPAMADQILGIIKSALDEGVLTRERLEASRIRIVNLKRTLSGSQKAVAAAGPKNE